MEEARFKRIDAMADIVEGLCSLFLNSLYYLQFIDTDKLEPYRDKGFVLLPKHQSNLDIPLEGALLKRTLGRHGNYPMKKFPWYVKSLFERLGGYEIPRLRDIRKEGGYSDKALRANLVDDARRRMKETEDYFSWLLQRDEIIIFHPEGKRYYKQTASIKPANLQIFLDIQKNIGKQIDFIPLNIKYQNLEKFRSKIRVTVGNPIRVSNDGLEDLVEHIRKEIWLLEKD